MQSSTRYPGGVALGFGLSEPVKASVGRAVEVVLETIGELTGTAPSRTTTEERR